MKDLIDSATEFIRDVLRIVLLDEHPTDNDDQRGCQWAAFFIETTNLNPLNSKYHEYQL